MADIEGQRPQPRTLTDLHQHDLHQQKPVAAAAEQTALPLCVDLDGTLVKSDTLRDSLLVLVRQRPFSLLQLPFWVLQGKAAFKAHIAKYVTLDAAHLPYNRPLLQFLEQQHATGRPIYLATAADEKLAKAIAAHLGLFTATLASDGSTNLAGEVKLAAFRAQFPQGFCYIGNAKPDAPILAACSEPMVANPHRSLQTSLRRAQSVPAKKFMDTTPLLPRLLKTIRLHQWAKNVLIFLPLLLAHELSGHTILAGALAFLSFSLCASATYILNDLLDIESDRRHPVKRRRPFAAGELSVFTGLGLMALLAAASVAIAFCLPHMAGGAVGGGLLHPAGRNGLLLWLAVYVALTLAYSLRLKRMVLVDVIVLSALYTLRILAGSAATGIAVSPWLGGFSLFFFLSLAFVKRFSELENLRARGGVSSSGRGYHVGDLEQLRVFGSASAFAAVLVFTLYINNPVVSALYRHPARLWLLTPILILWLCRIWLKTSRGEMDEDPVVYALTDKHSILLGLLSVAVVLCAAAAH
jgi:4-hydroxybenzoate polyprenyltransferase